MAEEISTKNKDMSESGVGLDSPKRVYAAGGLLFGLMILMVLSGLASVTLLYDDVPSATPTQGLEGYVLGIVQTLSPAIRITHEYGGYVAMFLSGWLALEFIRFGKNSRTIGTSKDKSSGLLIMIVGVPSAVALSVLLVLLVGTGIEARKFMDEAAVGDFQELPGAGKLSQVAAAEEKGVVEAHIGMLTLAMAGMIILLVVAVQLTQRTATARIKKEPKAG